VDFRFSAENATTQKSIFGKVDFRFSAENATTKTNPDAKPRATPGALSCMGASDPSVVIARVIAAARVRTDVSVATT
jgi:hypothetical protein